MAKAPTIGIDLGTTSSCVAIFENGKPEVIVNDKGERTTPSYVAFTKKERLIGSDAKRQAGGNPKNTVFGIKRIIGRKSDDPVIQQDIKDWLFLVKNIDGEPAALAYGIDMFEQQENERKILIFDLGKILITRLIQLFSS